MNTLKTPAIALLLIDPFNDFLSQEGKLYPYVREVAERVNLVPNLRRLLEAARKAEARVVYVPHRKWSKGDFDGCTYMNPTHLGVERLHTFERGSWGADFHPDLAPRPGELIAGEHWMHDGFSNTDLNYLLRSRGVERVIIAGMRANACIEATARRAVELGFHVTMVKDATACFREEEWRATLEINAPSYAHGIATTDEVLELLEST